VCWSAHDDSSDVSELNYSRQCGADVTVDKNVGHTSRLFVIRLLGVGQVCSSH
jgi:hypothetical protein